MNNPELIKQITRYYYKGLNATEIAKLLDLAPRTCQRIIKAANLDKPRAAPPKPNRVKAAALVEAGFTYSEIARRLKVSKSTVYNWQRAARRAASASGKPSAGKASTKGDGNE